MTKYLYDEDGNRYRKENDDSDSGEGGFFLILIALLLIIAFAPGMVVSSLFANNIDTSLWAWIWTVLFSVGVFFLIYWAYWASIKLGNPWTWTLWTYAVFSGLSIWLLFASEAGNIIKICKLLKLESIG
jgi:hypothetical protein